MHRNGTVDYSLAVSALALILLALGVIVAQAQGDIIASCGIVERRAGLLGYGSGYDSIVGPEVLVIRIEGVIDYAMRDYLVMAIDEAERRGVPLIVELNTPGGLVDPALEMASSISNAAVPVIGYVVEKWAESAGTMILMSTHIAAMQPGTIIGSVQPVAYDPSSGSYSPINESKIINPIIKTMCENGATKGRNESALIRFVTKNDNYGAEEALRYGVIEVVASTRLELIEKLNESVVLLSDGRRVKLVLNGLYEELSPSLRITILHILSDPLLAGILLSIGALALLFSIASGNLAGIALSSMLLLLGLAGSGFNPNIASLLLILIGALMVFIELYTPGFGIIGGSGILMLVLGMALLPASPGEFAISEGFIDNILMVLYAIGASMGAATAMVVYKVLHARKPKPYIWSLESKKGIALESIKKGETGFVMIEGEYWKAIAEDDISKGDRVVVVSKEGPLIKVRKHAR